MYDNNENILDYLLLPLSSKELIMPSRSQFVTRQFPQPKKLKVQGYIKSNLQEVMNNIVVGNKITFHHCHIDYLNSG